MAAEGSETVESEEADHARDVNAFDRVRGEIAYPAFEGKVVAHHFGHLWKEHVV